jgi:hypothetical protein
MELCKGEIKGAAATSASAAVSSVRLTICQLLFSHWESLPVVVAAFELRHAAQRRRFCRSLFDNLVLARRRAVGHIAGAMALMSSI